MCKAAIHQYIQLVGTQITGAASFAQARGWHFSNSSCRITAAFGTKMTSYKQAEMRRPGGKNLTEHAQNSCLGPGYHRHMTRPKKIIIVAVLITANRADLSIGHGRHNAEGSQCF